MTPSALAVMLVSVGSVLALVTFCLYRVLSLPPAVDEDLKGPLGVNIGDAGDAD
jgi:hypothetical protein